MRIVLYKLRDALACSKHVGIGLIELNHHTINLNEYHYITYSCLNLCDIGVVRIWKHKPRFNKTSLCWKNSRSKYNDDPDENITILSYYLDEDVSIVGTKLEDCDLCLEI